MKTSIYWQDPKYPAKRMDFIFDPSLVLYLPLHRLDGASFMSKDAYGHLCTVTGALWTPRGRSFDGADDYIDCGTIISTVAQTELTVECWLYPDTITNDDGVFRIGTQGDFGSMVAFIYDSDMCCGIGGAYFDIKVSGFSATAWQHFGLIYNAGNLDLYLNGSLLDSATGLSSSIDFSGANAGILQIGRYGSHYLAGDVGSFKVYNRVLTPLEIQHNYLATKWRYQ